MRVEVDVGDLFKEVCNLVFGILGLFALCFMLGLVGGIVWELFTLGYGVATG